MISTPREIQLTGECMELKEEIQRLKENNTRRLGLLRRLSESGMLHDITCELLEDVDDEDYCEDCALLRELAEELSE